MPAMTVVEIVAGMARSYNECCWHAGWYQPACMQPTRWS